MNSKHLAKGSQCPPFGKDDHGEFCIYSMRFCPYAQRAVLVAHAKQLKFSLVHCDLTDKADWLLAKNPNGKVPILETKQGKIIYESLIVADYLDDVYPQKRPLNSADPFLKAWDRVLIEEFNKVANLFFSIVSLARKEDASKLKDALASLKAALDPFEKELRNRGTPYFGGRDAPGMLDYMMWPWFERLPVIKLFKACEDLDFDGMKKEAPLLESWRQAMKEDPAVKASFLSPQIHKKFIENYFGGKPSYDDVI